LQGKHILVDNFQRAAFRGTLIWIEEEKSPAIKNL